MPSVFYGVEEKVHGQELYFRCPSNPFILRYKWNVWDISNASKSVPGDLFKNNSSIDSSSSFLIQLCISLQNILFYYDGEQSARPSGVVFLEGCYCERLVSAPSGLGTPGGTNGGGSHKHSKEEKLQVRLMNFSVLNGRELINYHGGNIWQRTSNKS